MKRTPSPLAHLDGALERLRGTDRLRIRPKPYTGLSFCSNDYLGLAATPATSIAVGAGASRMIAGEHVEHGKLEAALVEWLDAEAALLFSSGYAANLGALAALIDPGDLVVSDALNHASIIDGIRLSRASVAVVPHLDVGAVARALQSRSQEKPQRRWVVTETYFSMDADAPDLAALRRVCDEHGAALFVDEAHAIGVLGPDGRGLCAAAGIVPDVCVGTLGKGLGAAGAFVVGCQALVDWLWNRGRSHVFSTGISPAIAATATLNIGRARSEPALRERAVRNGERFRTAARSMDLDVRGFGPIVPCVLGSEASALAVAGELEKRGVHVVAIRPPTVPDGTSRLRFAFTANHTDEDVDLAASALAAAVACIR